MATAPPMKEPTEPVAKGGGEDLLGVIETAILAEVLEAHVEDVQMAMLNAEKVLWDPSMTKEVFADIGQMTVDDPQKVALGALGLVTMMRDEENMRFPDVILVPVSALAGVAMLRFMVESGMLEPQVEFVGNVFEEMFAVLMQKLHIGPEDVQSMAQERMGLNPNDPEQMLQQQPAGLIDGAMA